MLGRPSIHAKSAQKVIHYMLSQQDLVVKAWRSRIYSYSSATWLKLTGAPLIDWINETPHLHKLRVRCLQKLTDEGDLYELIGTAIIEFMKKKSSVSPCHVFATSLLGNQVLEKSNDICFPPSSCVSTKNTKAMEKVQRG